MKANPYAEAVEAGSVGLVEWLASPAEVQDLTPADWLQARKMSEAAVAAAMGPLLAPVRALHERKPGHSLCPRCSECGHAWPCPTVQALDAIEAGVTSEGGARCVTVTRRCRDGEWEGDDLPTPDEALRMGWSV